MVTTLDDKLLADMVAAIVRSVDPERIYLFGSHARGDAKESSDVDFLIVQSGDFTLQRDRRGEECRLYRVLASYPVDVDVLVYSTDEVEYRRHGRNNVVARALKEGRLVYDRP